MHKKISFLVFFTIFTLAVTISLNSSINGVNEIPLVEGKNDVTFNISEPFYVRTLVELNPKIEAVSFSEGNKTIGYINTFGGIGKNFPVTNLTSYEVIVSEETALILPG